MWETRGKEHRRHSSLLKKTAQRMRSAGVCKAWALWLENAMELNMQAGVSHKVLLRWKSQSMAKMYQAWATTFLESKRLRRTAAKVVRQWRLRVIARAWAAWSEMGQARCRLVSEEEGWIYYQQLVMSVVQAAQLSLSKCFYCWSVYISGQRRLVLMAESLLQNIQATITVRLMEDMFMTWCAPSTLKQEHEPVFVQGLAALSTLVADTRSSRRDFMAGQVMHRCQQKALRRALECWYELHVQLLMQYHQSSRILMRRTSGAKAAALLTWYQAYATARGSSFKARKVLARWEHNRYGQAFGTWQVLTNAWRKLRLSASELVKRLANKSQASTWGTWCGKVARSRLANEVTLRRAEKAQFAAWIMWETQVDKALVIDSRLKNFIIRRLKHVKMILATERWKQQSDERKQFARAAEKIVLRRRNICQALAMVQWVEHSVRRKQFARAAEKIALRRRNICQAVATGAVTEHRWVEHLREEKSPQGLTQNLSRRLLEESEEDVLMSPNEDQILCGKEGFHELNQVRFAVYTCETEQSDNSPIKFLDGPRRTPLKIEQKGL